MSQNRSELGFMPVAFTEDRRGKPPRTDRDYALLADLFIRTTQALYQAEWDAMPRRRYRLASRSTYLPDLDLVARHVARFWASEYGGAVKTWRQRLTRARTFLDPGEESEYMDGRIDWDDEARGYLWLTEEGFRLAYGCEYHELAARLFEFRHANKSRNLFKLSDREVASMMLKVPKVSVPPQPPPPRRRDRYEL